MYFVVYLSGVHSAILAILIKQSEAIEAYLIISSEAKAVCCRMAEEWSEDSSVAVAVAVDSECFDVILR